MLKILKPAVMILLGVVIGILVYHEFGVSVVDNEIKQDTSEVTFANAQNIVQTQYYQDEINQDRHNAITQAIQKVSPAVVSVNVTKVQEYVVTDPFFSNDPFFGPLFGRRVQGLVKAIGSGFLVSKDGYILTNEHVVQNATEIIVAKSDGGEFPAKLIGSDRAADVALLKIEGDDHAYIPFGNSDDLIIGEWAIALGNPFGLFVKSKPTVTVGVISATNRDFAKSQGRVYEDMIQTDASINHGNSGGPLCNSKGEVIGMNTFIITGKENQTVYERESAGFVGIGFAIPINRIARIMNDLKVSHGVDRDYWIGISVYNLSRYLSRLLNYPSSKGVYVAQIDKGSPAEKAGIELGDIITYINEREITNDNDATTYITSKDLKVGDRLKFKVWRKGKILDITVKLEKRNR
jgi:serine protease Do